MTLLLVPTNVETTNATVWLGSIDESPRALLLAYACREEPVAESAWSTVPSEPGCRSVQCARVRLTNLSPATPYGIVLRQDGVERVRGSVKTLPTTLPTTHRGGFRAMLGSCFAAKHDAGQAGQTFA